MSEASEAASKRKRTPPRELTLDLVKPHFELPLRQAARELNVSINFLKRACRRAGIKRWPYKKLRGVRTALAGLLQQAKNGRDSKTIETIIASLREEEALLLQGITADSAAADDENDEDDEDDDAQDEEENKSAESSKQPRISSSELTAPPVAHAALRPPTLHHPLPIPQQYAQALQRERHRQHLDPLLAYHSVPSIPWSPRQAPPQPQSILLTGVPRPIPVDTMPFHRLSAAAPPSAEYMPLLQMVHEMQQSLGALVQRVQQLEEYIFLQTQARDGPQAHFPKPHSSDSK